MKNINNIPSGLLSLLQLKEQGQNPNELGNLVVPTLDLLPFYMATLQTDQVQVSAAINAVGAVLDTTLVVPPNEVWLVSHYSVIALMGAAQTITVQPLFRPLVVNQALGPAVAVAANQQGIAITQTLPFIARQGSAFGCNVQAITGGPLTVSFAVTFIRLRI